MGKEAKRALSFERRIISKKPDDVPGWIAATLECGHVVEYCTPSVDFKSLHCGECVTAYLLTARAQRAAPPGSVLTEEQLNTLKDMQGQ